jgi:hypothetical protein
MLTSARTSGLRCHVRPASDARNSPLMPRVLSFDDPPPRLVQLLFMVVIGVVVVIGLSGAGSDAVRCVAVFLMLATALTVLPRRAALWGFAILIVAWFLGAGGPRYLPDLYNPQPSVASSIGGAAFVDSPYEGSEIAAVLALIVVLAAAGVYEFVRVRRGRAAEPDSAPTTKNTTAASAKRLGRPTAAAAVVTVGTALIAFTIVPDLRAYVLGYTTPLVYNWDLSNLESWQAFVGMGLTPMKDFFYPYGFQYLFTLRSFGPVFQWLEQVLCLAIVAWSTWRLTGGHAWRTLACVLLTVLVGQWAVELWRYLPALLIPVSYAALGQHRDWRPTASHGVFLLTCVLAGLVEADLLLLGFVGLACVVAGDVVAGDRAWCRGRLVARWAVDLAPIIVAGVMLIVIWAALGSLAGNLRFFTDFSAVSASSAADEQIYGAAGLLGLTPNAYSLGAALPVLLAALGVVWARSSPTNAGPRAVLLGAAGVSLMMLLKNLVRPIGDLDLMLGLLGLGWMAIMALRPGSLWRAGAAGAAIGAMLCLLNATSALTSYATTVVHSPEHAVNSISTTFNRKLRTQAADAEFSPARFQGWPDEVINGYFQASVPAGTAPSFAIFGDSAMTYVFLKQPPPWEVDIYDAGPIREQRHMLSVLERTRPAYMIWRRDFNQDGVLYNIRAPVVFNWMVRHYVPVEKFPTVDILRRRSPGQPIPTSYWISRLSTTEALQYIPSLSTAGAAPRCASGPGCVSYALARGSAAAGSTATIQISGRGLTFDVTFDVRAGVHTYPVRLDRLWFWSLVGPRATIRATSLGFTATRVGLRSGGNLY